MIVRMKTNRRNSNRIISRFTGFLLTDCTFDVASTAFIVQASNSSINFLKHFYDMGVVLPASILIGKDAQTLLL